MHQHHLPELRHTAYNVYVSLLFVLMVVLCNHTIPRSQTRCICGACNPHTYIHTYIHAASCNEYSAAGAVSFHAAAFSISTTIQTTEIIMIYTIHHKPNYSSTHFSSKLNHTFRTINSLPFHTCSTHANPFYKKVHPHTFKTFCSAPFFTNALWSSNPVSSAT